MHMNAQHCACNPHAIRGAGENQIFVACRESIRVICCNGPFASSCRKLHAKYMCFEQEWQGCVSLCMRGHARGWQSRGWGRCSIAKSGPAAMPVLLFGPRGIPKHLGAVFPCTQAYCMGIFWSGQLEEKKKWASASPMRSIGQAAPRCLAIPHAHEN
jgi:hypothetical protein